MVLRWLIMALAGTIAIYSSTSGIGNKLSARKGNIGCEVEQQNLAQGCFKVKMWDCAIVGTGMTFDVKWTVTYYGAKGKLETFNGITPVHVRPQPNQHNAKYTIGYCHYWGENMRYADISMVCRSKCGAITLTGDCIEINEIFEFRRMPLYEYSDDLPR